VNRTATTTVTVLDTATEVSSEAQNSDPTETRRTPVRLALVVGTGFVTVLAALAAWNGHQAFLTHQAEQRRAQVLSVAEQAALNLTTIRWQQVDSDIQRILDGAAGGFHDDFAQRAPQFVEVVEQAKSTTSGAITAAGVESQTSDEASVLVTVNVKTSDAAVPDPSTRLWRMRLLVHSSGDDMKVSKVEFVA
jgi:Mce-associated membrane protein